MDLESLRFQGLKIDLTDSCKLCYPQWVNWGLREKAKYRLWIAKFGRRRNLLKICTGTITIKKPLKRAVPHNELKTFTLCFLWAKKRLSNDLEIVNYFSGVGEFCYLWSKNRAINLASFSARLTGRPSQNHEQPLKFVILRQHTTFWTWVFELGSKTGGELQEQPYFEWEPLCSWEK